MHLLSPSKITLILLLLVFYFIARSHHAPPRPVREQAPAPAYSAERAYTHIEKIASQPHPTGSPQAMKVRDYIAAQIRLLGLEPQIQEAVVYRPPATFATVHNIVTRIEGTSKSRNAVALMAHYDSVVFGPGAADDSSGVAAMLEAMRALLSDSPLTNDIIFIFTDGEEGRSMGGTGLRGAYAFVEQHPWAKEVRVVINFDAWGTEGQSYMYQTSGMNQWLITQLAESKCNAAATSLGYEVYSRMPVGSDLSAFIDAGIPGYDCAFIQGLEKYHTMLDSPENLSLASLQHDGEYALTLTRHLASQALDASRGIEKNLVYFDFPIIKMVHYSEGVSLIFILFTLALYVVLIVVGRLRNDIKLKSLLTAAFFYLLWFTLCCIVGSVIMLLTYQVRGIYMLYSSDAFTLGLMLIISGASILVLNRVVDKYGTYNAFAGFLMPWAFVATVTPFYMPGAGYVFTWPLLFTLLCVGMGLLLRHTWKNISVPCALFLGVSAFPTILFTVGIIQGFYAALLFIFVSLHIAVLLFAVAMLMPQLYLLTVDSRRRVTAIIFILGALFLVAGILWPGFSAQQPKFNSITYGLDADTGEAVYMSCDDAVDPWTQQFLGENPQRLPITDFIPIAENSYLQAPAPSLNLAPPTVDILDDKTSGDLRTVHLRIDSPRKAEVIEVYALPGTEVLSAAVNKIAMTSASTPWRLSYSIYRGDGIDVVLELPAGSPARFRIADHQYYLEDVLDFEPRPPQYIPKPNTVDFNRDPLKSEESIVATTFELPGDSMS